MGNGYIGNGADVATVMRSFQRAAESSGHGRQGGRRCRCGAFCSRLTSCGRCSPGGSNGLGAAINGMMNAFADVSSAPTDSSARQVVLTRMNELAARFRSASGQLDEMDYSTRQQMSNDVNVVSLCPSRWPHSTANQSCHGHRPRAQACWTNATSWCAISACVYCRPRRSMREITPSACLWAAAGAGAGAGFCQAQHAGIDPVPGRRQDELVLSAAGR